MTLIEYNGSANIRKIPEAALTAAGFNVPYGLTWNKANNYEIDIPDPALVAWLLAQGGQFSTEESASFIDFLGKRTLSTSPSLEGLSALLYGNSYIGQDNMNTVGARWTDRVKRRLGLNVMTNRHEGGSSVWDIGKKMIGTVGAVPVVAGTRGIVMIGGVGLGEQLVASNGGDPVQRAYMKNTVRALIAAASSALRAESSTFTVSNAAHWTTSNQTYFSGGSYRFTGTEGGWIEYVAGTGTDWSTTHDIFIPSILDTYGRYYGTISVNGAVRKSNVGTLVNAVPEPTLALAGYDVYTITGINQGDTIRLTRGDLMAGGAIPSVGIDFASVRSKYPPLVVVTKDPEIGFGLTNVANYEEFRDAIQEACDEFPNAVCVDVGDGFDRATMIGSDTLHKNDLGQAHYADAVMDALSSIGFRHGQNLLTVTA